MTAEARKETLEVVDLEDGAPFRVHAVVCVTGTLSSGSLQHAIGEVLPDAIVHLASTEAQALGMIGTVRPELVVGDLDLLTGLLPAALSDGRRKLPHVIVCANRADDRRIHTWLRAGALGYLLGFEDANAMRQRLVEALSKVEPDTGRSHVA